MGAHADTDGKKFMHGDTQILASVGIGKPEEQCYVALLEHPALTLSEISRHLDISRHQGRKILESLEHNGLVTRSAERIHRYFPMNPDIAVEALIMKRKEELDRTRAAVSFLREKRIPESKAMEQKRLVEVVSGVAAQARLLEHMQRTTKSEFLCMERPPYIVTPPGTVDETESEMAEKGVSFRNLISPAVLEVPEALNRLRVHAESGEIVRVFPNLPTKLLVSDRRIGLIPLNLQNAEGPVLLVHSSALLDALCELFELIWQRATPLSFAGSSVFPTSNGSTRLPADPDRLVPLLAAGINDKTIAHEFGMSVRTLERRIVELMHSLDARTRFQAGWLAALRSHQELTNNA